jgi:transposase
MDKRVITARDTRRKHDDTFKRELVERSLQPGASVAAIAQEGGVNANLLFNWRRLHIRRAGGVAAGSPPPSTRLLPVVVEGLEERSAPSTGTVSAPSARAPTGVIEIDIGGARVRLRGVVEDATVRCVLQTLGRAA